MRSSAKLFTFLLVLALLSSGCGLIKSAGVQVITPSNVMTSETLSVSGFNAIDFGTMGKVIITQGNTESLSISGSDNVVPLIKTTVSNKTLVINTEKNITFLTFNENSLVITISVKDLSSLTVSGLGDIQMDALSTPSLIITMSGAGKLTLNKLTTDTLDVTLSGLGGVVVSGEAKQATIDLSGAGSVDAPDLKIQSANVTLPGLGSATLWVTDKLTGTISGAGSVSYYGNPQTTTNSTGLGSFKSLGNK